MDEHPGKSVELAPGFGTGNKTLFADVPAQGEGAEDLPADPAGATDPAIAGTINLVDDDPATLDDAPKDVSTDVAADPVAAPEPAAAEPPTPVDPPAQAAEPVPEESPFVHEANSLRRHVKVLAHAVKELKFAHALSPVDPVEDRGEVAANLMLTYRHLEDASMRLGKAIQASDGGVSVYDRATTVGA